MAATVVSNSITVITHTNALQETAAIHATTATSTLTGDLLAAIRTLIIYIHFRAS